MYVDEETMRRKTRQLEEAEAKLRSEREPKEKSYGDDVLARLKKYEAEYPLIAALPLLNLRRQFSFLSVLF